MTVVQVESRGIYHGLPVFPDSLTGLTAIITGANGISGQHMLRVLGQSPARWSKIYCLSRRPPALPNGIPANTEHIPLDFMTSPEEIAKVLRDKGIHADYVFFFSYIQAKPLPGGSIWSNAEEMCRVNTQLLSNFLEALPLAAIKPRRILLQTGAKNYGLHLGPTTLPQEESDTRVTIEPNFYYNQEDCLWTFCEQHSIGWNVIRPGNILGAVPDAAMNLCYPLAVYATVCKHLNRPLDFPGCLGTWEILKSQSSAMMNSYLSEWAVLTESAKNEAFNAADSSPFTWGKFWPKLADWYGLEYENPDPSAPHELIKSPYPPPRGFGPARDRQFKFSIVEWAKQPEVQDAWNQIAAKHGLQNMKLDNCDRDFGFLHMSFSSPWSSDLSMNKARKLGWYGFVDTTDSIQQVFHEFADMKMIPSLPGTFQT